MKFNETYDTTTVNNSYEPLPEGWYNVQITAEEDKDTKRGGVRIVYTMEVLDGKFKGRKLFDSHNYVCPGSPKTEEIARDNIKACAHACGLSNISDSSQLLGRICCVKAVIKKDDGYDPQNEVRGYRKAEGYNTPSPAPAPQPSAPQQASAPTTPPWQR